MNRILFYLAILFFSAFALANASVGTYPKQKTKEYRIAPQTPPPLTQESIDLAMEIYEIKKPKNVKRPLLDLDTEYRGLATRYGPFKKIEIRIGRAAFSSWAILGSTLAHEIEVHGNQNFSLINLKERLGFEGTKRAERDAYLYELENASRFRLSNSEIASIVGTVNDFYSLHKAED